MKRLLVLLGLSLTATAHPLWIERGEWGSRPQPLPESALHQPDRVVLHHAGVLWKSGDDAWKKIRALQSWGQREKGWPDLPYHFLIAPDGTIFEGRELRYRPESNTDYDLAGAVNVQLWGDFEQQALPSAQWEATRRLLRWLSAEQGLRRLSAHCLEAPGQTSCPGAALMQRFPELKAEMIAP